MAKFRNWKIDTGYDAWIETWRISNPLPPMSKKARWRFENAAWLEMRRLEKKRERDLSRMSLLRVTEKREQ